MLVQRRETFQVDELLKMAGSLPERPTAQMELLTEWLVHPLTRWLLDEMEAAYQDCCRHMTTEGHDAAELVRYAGKAHTYRTIKRCVEDKFDSVKSTIAYDEELNRRIQNGQRDEYRLGNGFDVAE